MAAEIVAPFLNNIPMALAVNKKLETVSAFFFSENNKAYNKTAGTTPAAPLVGAVTTLPKEAFCSFTAKAKQLTQSRMVEKFCPVFLMASIHSFIFE